LSPISHEKIQVRLDILMPQFKNSIRQKDFQLSKRLLAEIQPLLKNIKKNALLIEARNLLFELAVEKKEYDYAIEGFLMNRKLISKTTRLHLEATALLAITYLRIDEFEKAKPFIKEVLQNKNVIKTESTRNKFNEAIIQRFDEESALLSLKATNIEKADIDNIHSLASQKAQSLNEEQLYSELGSILPKATKEMLFMVHDFSKNQLTYTERLLLPSAQDAVKDDKAGKTVFSSFKRVLYNSICDPKSEVYKGWYTNAVGSVLDKKFITGAVVAALTGYGIGYIGLIIAAAALILRFGLDVYCERYRPAEIMELRRKSE
jgi:hypothetical protein